LQLTTHLSTRKDERLRITALLADLSRTIYPHKWSPVSSCRPSARQEEFAGGTQEAQLLQRGRAILSAVVSFNSTIPRAHSYIITHFGFRFTSAYKSILLCSLRRPIDYTIEVGGSALAVIDIRRRSTIPICVKIQSFWRQRPPL